MKAHWMTSSYDCKCVVCGDDIRIGDRIVVMPGEVITKKMSKNGACCKRCGTVKIGTDKSIPQIAQRFPFMSQLN